MQFITRGVAYYCSKYCTTWYPEYLRYVVIITVSSQFQIPIIQVGKHPGALLDGRHQTPTTVRGILIIIKFMKTTKGRVEFIH